MKIKTDCRAGDAEAANENFSDKISRRGRRQRGVERHDDRAVEPGAGEQPQLVALARELEQRLLRAEKFARMRRKSQRGCLAAKLFGARPRNVDHGAVATVQACLLY